MKIVRSIVLEKTWPRLLWSIKKKETTRTAIKLRFKYLSLTSLFIVEKKEKQNLKLVSRKIDLALEKAISNEFESIWPRIQVPYGRFRLRQPSVRCRAPPVGTSFPYWSKMLTTDDCMLCLLFTLLFLFADTQTTPRLRPHAVPAWGIVICLSYSVSNPSRLTE